jgi:opacity protein-like surface antigen
MSFLCSKTRSSRVAHPRLSTLVGLLAFVSLLAASAIAESDDAVARDDRIHQLEKQVQILAEELSRVRTQVAVPEDADLKGAYGFGPAASKIYGVDRGLSIGGYGEYNYTNFVGDEGSTPDLDRADALRTVLYFGYKFTENIVFNSEIEFEHGSTSDVKNGEGGGSASVELASLDFFHTPELNFRAGLLLAPIGFVNEVHEPPFFYGVKRPEVETRIIPSTFRNLGAGIFGQIGENFEYRAYVMTGFNGARFSDAGFRSARQKGNRAIAEDLAFVFRGDYRPEVVPGLEFGGSFYIGDVDQDTGLSLSTGGATADGMPITDALLYIAEGHLQYRDGPLSARLLAAYTHLDEAADFNASVGRSRTAPIAENMLGAYAELGYDIWPHFFGSEEKALEPFMRVEYVDTQYEVPGGFIANRNRAYWVHTAGMNYYPHPNVVLKIEYRNLNARGGTRPDELALGVGFAF